MKRSPRTVLSILLAWLALTAAAAGLCGPPRAEPEASCEVAQSTSTILERRGA